jgi:hypothetical protein
MVVALRKDKISLFVKRVKKDEKLNRLVNSYSIQWLWCEATYESAVQIQKSILTRYQSQVSIQEVDDCDDCDVDSRQDEGGEYDSNAEYTGKLFDTPVDIAKLTSLAGHGCHNTRKRRRLKLVTLPQTNTETIGRDGGIGEDGGGSQETFQQSRESGVGSARARDTQNNAQAIEMQTGKTLRTSSRPG